MPLMPMPPMPTKWILAGLERKRLMSFAPSGSEVGRAHRLRAGLAGLAERGAPAPADELGADVRDLPRGLGAAEAACGARHPLAALGGREDGADLPGEQLAGELALLDHHRRARVHEALRVQHLV